MKTSQSPCAPFYGDGTQTRSFGFVADLIASFD